MPNLCFYKGLLSNAASLLLVVGFCFGGPGYFRWYQGGLRVGLTWLREKDSAHYRPSSWWWHLPGRNATVRANPMILITKAFGTQQQNSLKPILIQINLPQKHIEARQGVMPSVKRCHRFSTPDQFWCFYTQLVLKFKKTLRDKKLYSQYCHNSSTWL